MPVRDEKRLSLRLGSAHRSLLSAIAEEKRWSEAETVRVALEQLGRRVLGRRMADLAPIRIGRPRKAE